MGSRGGGSRQGGGSGGGGGAGAQPLVAGNAERALDLGPNPGLKTALAAHERSIRNNHYEHARIVDGQGNVLLAKRGARDYVSFNAHEVRLMAGAHITHNHPSGAGFSGGDIKTLVEGKAAEMRAVGAVYRYSARPPSGGWPKGESVAHLSARITAAHETLLRYYVNKYLGQVRSGRISEDQAWLNASHRAMQRLAASTGIRYQRTMWAEYRGTMAIRTR